MMEPENQLEDLEVQEILDNSLEMQPEKKKMKKDTESKGVSILEFLEDHLPESCHLYQFLKKMVGFMLTLIQKKCLVPVARDLKIALQSVLRYLTKIESTGKEYTIEGFYSLLRDAKLYTTFTKEFMTATTYCELTESMEEFSTGVSTSLLSTMDTSTSCMTAIPPETDVDAPEFCSGSKNLAQGGLDALFEQQVSPQDTGKISQTISKMVNGKLFTWKSPGEHGYQVIRLDVYDFKNVIDKVSSENHIIMY